MINPILRTVTGWSTIPAGVSKAGTLTTNAVNSNYLTYSGSAAALDAIMNPLNTNNFGTKDNLWVYLLTSHKVFKVLSWGDVNIYVEGDATGVAGENWELVEADLQGWSVTNEGASAGTVNGASIASTVSVSDLNSPVKKDVTSFCDCVLVNGTGTTLLILEKRK